MPNLFIETLVLLYISPDFTQFSASICFHILYLPFGFTQFCENSAFVGSTICRWLGWSVLIITLCFIIISMSDHRWLLLIFSYIRFEAFAFYPWMYAENSKLLSCGIIYIFRILAMTIERFVATEYWSWLVIFMTIKIRKWLIKVREARSEYCFRNSNYTVHFRSCCYNSRLLGSLSRHVYPCNRY